MKSRLFILILLGLIMINPAAHAVITAAPPDEGKPAAWSVTGQWLTKDPNWTDIVVIRADGTFARSGGDGGKWKLGNEKNQPVLVLNWERWKSQTVALITPDRFRGALSGGTLELQRVTPQEAAAFLERARPAKEFDDPALKARLSGSVWRLQDGKHFTLHADGSTTGDWHERKGFWRIVGPGKVQLTIMWKPKLPSTVSVESDGTILRWSDEEWSQMARRVEPNK